jgi:hypothetical protein
MIALADNDILLKAACYRLLAELIPISCDADRVGYLGAAKFVLGKKIRRMNLCGNVAEAHDELLTFLATNEAIETTAEEQELAAILEATAQTLSVNLDTGESQLLAVLVSRALPKLLTGDKRAIIAIERLLDVLGTLSSVIGKVSCLEQIVKHVFTQGNPDSIRMAICREPDVDKALSICFSCHGPEQPMPPVVEALDSYISDLRRNAPRALST